ncbi:MAG: transporter, partial [Rhizobium sp.]
MMLLPGRGISIAQLGDAFALFNCAEQRLYEIDERAAWAWRFVSDNAAGVDRSHMSAQLSSRFRLTNTDADA